MWFDFRDVIEAQREAGELRRVTRPVDIRYVGTLVEQSKQALLFEKVAGYDMPVVAGLMNSRQRSALCFSCSYSEISQKLEHGIAHPVPYVMTSAAPSREVRYQIGQEVDLYSLPVPLFARMDGGPMITAGVMIARDDEGGLNSGVYRLLVRQKNLTNIDLVTPNDLRRIAERNTAAGMPTPISVSIGTNPAVTLATAYRPPPHVDELEIAGGILGQPVRLAECETIDVPCVADAEIVLEAEILPTGWTKPEGRFGEFHRSMGALHWNPDVRIKAIYTRRQPIYWALHMPWEVIWLSGAIQEASLRRSLRESNLRVSAINVTPGGSCYFHAVIALQARVGDGKMAVLSALASDDFKHIVVVDDDIDVFDPIQVEWALATRVQADKDVVIASGLRAKPLDPSLELVTGRMPTTAKMGIDATIPRDLPRDRFVPIKFAFDDVVDAEKYLADTAASVPQDTAEVAVEQLADDIAKQLEAGPPRYHYEFVERYWSAGFVTLNRALAVLHEREFLWQDELGRLCPKDSKWAASPPTSKFTNRA